MQIVESIIIHAPIDIVWNVFTDVGNWSGWNAVCRECRMEQGDAISQGTCLSFELTPLLFGLRIAPVVSECCEKSTIVWHGAKWGIRATHRFSFNSLGGRTELTSVEDFSGPMLWAVKIAGIHRRLHGLTRQLLFSVRAEAERRSATPGRT